MGSTPVRESSEREPVTAPLGFLSVADADPHRVAITEVEGRSITYGELAGRVGQLSHLLNELGLAPGDCAAALLPNRREYHELRLATGQTGFYFAPINHHLTAGEIAHIVVDSEAKALFVDESMVGTATEALLGVGFPADRLIVVGDSEHADYERRLASFPTAYDRPLLAGEYMGYTSGTTGRPKGVRKELSGKPPVLAASVVAYMARLGIYPGREVHLVTGPLSHAAPGTYSTLALQLGHTVIISERPSAEDILRLIDAHDVTIMFTVPTVMGRMLALDEDVRTSYDTSSLTCLLHAGSPCPPDLKRRLIAWLGPVVMEFYGATEGSATALTASEWLTKPGSVGYAIPGGEIRILDESGAHLGPGQIGTVYFRPATRFEYFKAPEKTRSVYRDGLVTAGDLGHVDEDGWLFLADRREDLIISGGVNVYPAEVEATLLESPLVVDVAVVGLPDKDWGHRVAAVVQVEPHATVGDSLADELVEHCRSRLAGFKIPRQIEFVQNLPRNSTGKLLRRQIRAEFAAGHNKRSTP